MWNECGYLYRGMYSVCILPAAGCTIWEGCDMKKVDLTTLDICSVIVNRVESMPQSTDYLVFGTYSYAGRLRIYISVP